MFKFVVYAALPLWVMGCATTPTVTDKTIAAAAAKLDFGDYASSTLTTKAWEASAAKDYLAVFAYTRECIRRYGDKAKQMNAEMDDFAPTSGAAEKWALNDVGTSLFIMGNAYADLKMYEEAARAFERLATNYSYTQCWDPKGWYWRPAEGAHDKAKRYRHLSRAPR